MIESLILVKIYVLVEIERWYPWYKKRQNFVADDLRTRMMLGSGRRLFCKIPLEYLRSNRGRSASCIEG